MALAFQNLAMCSIGHLKLSAKIIENITGTLSYMGLQTAVGQHLDVTLSEWTKSGYRHVIQAKSRKLLAKSGIKNHQPIQTLLDGLVNNVAAMVSI